jgi:hypothetical protein
MGIVSNAPQRATLLAVAMIILDAGAALPASAIVAAVNRAVPFFDFMSSSPTLMGVERMEL